MGGECSFLSFHGSPLAPEEVPVLAQEAKKWGRVGHWETRGLGGLFLSFLKSQV